jgi:hypothetical protein
MESSSPNRHTGRHQKLSTQTHGWLTRAKASVIKNFRRRRPNRVTLVTTIGSSIERTSYPKIGLIITAVIMGCALYYCVANSYHHGTDASSLSWWDALYFSIITFSSLGYGDIGPIGFGRVIASLEVLFGLVSIAVFVGKVASERQATLQLLSYTNDRQNKIEGFIDQGQRFERAIDSALSNHNRNKVFKVRHQLYAFLSGIDNYLSYQATVVGLANHGNNATLRRLYKLLAHIQILAYEVVRTNKIEQRTQTRYDQIIRRIAGISTTMLPYHQADDKALRSLNKMQDVANYVEKWKAKPNKIESDYEHRTEVTPKLLKKVLAILVTENFHKDIYKTVASRLMITNRLAERCVGILSASGRWSAPLD